MTISKSVQFSCSVVSDCLQCHGSMPHFPGHHQLPESTQTHVHWVVMPFNHLNLCCPLLLLPSIFPSIRVFSNEPDLRMRWPKYWSFSISPFNEFSGLIAFRMDWLDLLESLRDSQESFPTPQFKSINSLALSFLWRRQWHPTPVLLPGKSHRWRRLVGCSPWGH